MRTVTTEEARIIEVRDLEVTIAARDSARPEEGTPGHAVHEFGTAALRNELHWMRGCALPFDIHVGEGEAAGLVEIETRGCLNRADGAPALADIRDPSVA